MDSIEPVVASVTVDVPAATAFDRFTAGFGSWWPAEFSWSQPTLLASIGMQCREGGLLSELGPHGFRIDWGRVVTWEPPRRLVFLWQIGNDRVPQPDPEQASRVAVTVEPAGSGGSATVTVVHDRWERHGAGSAASRDGFTGAWPMALERFATTVAGDVVR